MENIEGFDQNTKDSIEPQHLQPELSAELSSNAAVERLVDTLNTSPIDWDTIIQRLVEKGHFKHKMTKGAMAGIALEEHVHLVTQGMIDRNEGIHPNPITTQTIGRFNFQKLKSGSLAAEEKIDGVSVSGVEYDAVVTAEDRDSKLLTLIEAKAVAPKRAEGLSYTSTSGHSPGEVIVPPRLIKYLHPIQEIVRTMPQGTITGISFVLVIPQDTYGLEHYESQRNFTEKYGGKIAAVPISIQDLRNEVYDRLPQAPLKRK